MSLTRALVDSVRSLRWEDIGEDAQEVARHCLLDCLGCALAGASEPPVDILETDREVLVLAALPGVDADAVETIIEDGTLVLSGSRVLPRELETAVIHRLELPQGCFERRIPLPAGRYAEAVKAADPDALRVLRAFAKELGVLLTRLTGSVVVERLEREPRFRESGVSFVEASKRG